jgi:hypothetical protein
VRIRPQRARSRHDSPARRAPGLSAGPGRASARGQVSRGALVGAKSISVLAHRSLSCSVSSRAPGGWSPASVAHRAALARCGMRWDWRAAMMCRWWRCWPGFLPGVISPRGAAPRRLAPGVGGRRARNRLMETFGGACGGVPPGLDIQLAVLRGDPGPALVEAASGHGGPAGWWAPAGAACCWAAHVRSLCRARAAVRRPAVGLGCWDAG